MHRNQFRFIAACADASTSLTLWATERCLRLRLHSHISHIFMQCKLWLPTNKRNWMTTWISRNINTFDLGKSGIGIIDESLQMPRCIPWHLLTNTSIPSNHFNVGWNEFWVTRKKDILMWSINWRKAKENIYQINIGIECRYGWKNIFSDQNIIHRAIETAYYLTKLQKSMHIAKNAVQIKFHFKFVELTQLAQKETSLVLVLWSNNFSL